MTDILDVDVVDTHTHFVVFADERCILDFILDAKGDVHLPSKDRLVEGTIVEYPPVTPKMLKDGLKEIQRIYELIKLEPKPPVEGKIVNYKFGVNGVCQLAFGISKYHLHAEKDFDFTQSETSTGWFYFQLMLQIYNNMF